MSYLVNYSRWKKLYEAANGELSGEDLIKIPVTSGDSPKHALNPVAAKAYADMVAAAKADGIEWGITDSYRPFEVQNRIFDWDHFRSTGKRRKKGTSGTPVAYPGTSNHGWGSAVDLKVKYDDSAHKWLTANAGKFGFSNPFKNPKTEPWHWEHKESAKQVQAGEIQAPSQEKNDTAASSDQFIDQYVNEFMAKPSIERLIKNKSNVGKYMTDSDRKEVAAQLGVSIPELIDWSAGKINDRDFFKKAIGATLDKNKKEASLSQIQNGTQLLKSGSTGDAVTEIQKKLKEKGFLTKEPNGEFDKDTYNAVKEFQTKASIRIDGIVGPETYSALYNTSMPANTGPNITVDNNITPSQVSGKIRHSYTGEKAANIDLLINTMEKYGITNPYSQAGILSVIGKETNYIPKNEIMDYSKERLPEVWGIFSKTGSRVPKGQGQFNYNDLAPQYEHNPEKLANFVYGQKPYGMKDNAYGNTQPGDGWKYRGRGFNQVTFKSGYEKLGKEIGMDLVTNPDSMNDPKIAADVAIRFFKNRFKEKGLDPNQFTDVDSALVMFARANAGWGSDPNTAIAAARQKAPAFNIA